MLWIMAFHIISMTAWFAGLFYLPRLFVYHVNANDEIGLRRFEIMEKKLYYYIMTPAAVLTVTFGLSLLLLNSSYYLQAAWMHMKLFLVLLLVIYHCYCGILVKKFRSRKNQHSAKFYRFFNEIPTLFLISIVILVTVKPF